MKKFVVSAVLGSLGLVGCSGAPAASPATVTVTATATVTATPSPSADAAEERLVSHVRRTARTLTPTVLSDADVVDMAKAFCETPKENGGRDMYKLSLTLRSGFTESEVRAIENAADTQFC